MVVRTLSLLLRLALLSVALLLPACTDVRAESSPFIRTNQASEEDLHRQLAEVPVIGLGNSVPAVLQAYAVRIQHDLEQSQMPVAVLDALPLLEIRPDFRYLPLRRGDASRLNPRAAATMEVLARKLRIYLDRTAPSDDEGHRPGLSTLRTVLQSEVRGNKPEWLRAGAVPTLLQLLMHEEKSARLLLVELLQAIPEKVATEALARRAAFDLDPEVRQAAVAALRDRPTADSRPVLVELLRYPWAPVADHAAEALVNLHDEGAVPQLVAALDQPDPRLPQRDAEGHLVVREMVRLHHLTNCLVCHPLASTGTEPILAEDATLRLVNSGGLSRAGKLLRSTPGSLVSGGGYGGSGGGGGDEPALLRADITYLRQDFSTLQELPPVLASVRTASGQLSAPTQRFDFVVRKRPVSGAESNLLKTAVSERPEFPQRAAVAFALRQITGKDAGTTSAEWMKLYPDAKVEAEGGRLATALVTTKPERREQLIARYRAEKGLEYTLALAGAIPELRGEFQQHAREALAERLTRMTAASLRERMRESDPELRRAAAVASGRKGDAGMVPDLIGLLDDKEHLVATGAASALRELTGKSFTATKEWQEWWNGHKAEGRTR
jgi:HEAT repeat protein